MSELTVYANPNIPSLINEMGQSIARSQLLSCENEDQGRVLAMTCIAKGCDPLSLAQRFDIIQGNLSMKADAMLAEFIARGGKHRLIKRDSDHAAVELSKGDNTVEFSLTWEEAQQEPFTKDKNGIKKNYATPRARMQMLWARVISDGVRVIDPGVNLGVYTPEEIQDFDDVDSDAITVSADAVTVSAVADDPGCEVVQVDQPSEGVSEPTSGSAAMVDDAPLATGEQIQTITFLFGLFELTAEQQLANIKNNGGEDMASLPESGASELIERMKKAVEERAERFKVLFEKACQLPGQQDIGEKIKAKFDELGADKFQYLTLSQGNILLEGLEASDLSKFLELEKN